jgi:hypothetical protein
MVFYFSHSNLQQLFHSPQLTAVFSKVTAQPNTPIVRSLLVRCCLSLLPLSHVVMEVHRSGSDGVGFHYLLCCPLRFDRYVRIGIWFVVLGTRLTSV